MSDPAARVLEHALREHYGAPEPRDVTWRVLRELRGARGGRRSPARFRALAVVAAVLVAVAAGALWLRSADPGAVQERLARASAELRVFDARGGSSPALALAAGRVALAPRGTRVELPDGVSFDADAGTVFRWSSRNPVLELAAGAIDVAAAGVDLVVRCPDGRLELASGGRARLEVAPGNEAPVSIPELARSLAMQSQDAPSFASTVLATLLAGTGTLVCTGAAHPLETGRTVSIDASYERDTEEGDAGPNPFAGETGTWELEVRYLDSARTPQGSGVETVRPGPHPLSIVSDISITRGAGELRAHVVLKWEPGPQRFTGSFMDSFGGPIGVVRGVRREDGARVLELHRPDGRPFDVRMVTEREGDDRRRTLLQSREDGEWTTVREMVHRRAHGAGEDGGGSAPTASLFQVILEVRDVAEELAFYRDVLGFRVRAPEGEAGDPARSGFVVLDTGGALLALHDGRPAGDARSAARLSLRVPDLEEARERLALHGVETGEVRRPAPGVLVLDVRDPEGNLVHLEEHAGPPHAGGR